MDYGSLLLLSGGAGHTRDLRSPSDLAMAFFFYVKNLLRVEVLLRAAPRRRQR